MTPQEKNRNVSIISLITSIETHSFVGNFIKETLFKMKRREDDKTCPFLKGLHRRINPIHINIDHNRKQNDIIYGHQWHSDILILISTLSNISEKQNLYAYILVNVMG